MTMGDDNQRKMLGALGEVMRVQERLRVPDYMGGAAAEALRQIQRPDSSVNRLVEDIARHQSLIRAALGPLEDFRRMDSLINVKALLAETERTRTILSEYQKRFTVPRFFEAQQLISQVERSGAFASIRAFQSEFDSVRKAMEAMRTPWLDMQNKIQSVAGLAELHTIGISLKRFPAFDDAVTDALRNSLGDWRDRITWPKAIFSDPLARSDFYAGRGFNPHLTDFPADAFEESLNIAGLGGDGPELIEGYRGEGKPADEGDEEQGFARTSAAHNQLLRFETHMRRFIETSMAAAWGDKWIRQRVPSELRQQWSEKQQKARENGEDGYPLIAYADFTDYERIIVRSDNWDAIFKPIFRRREFVTEAFQRLYPIRLCTMHARIITQDDELFLQVEVKRLLRAIGLPI